VAKIVTKTSNVWLPDARLITANMVRLPALLRSV
jgi:hypothetical protein